jgi:hypothetical protein
VLRNLRQAHAAHPGDDHQSFRLLDSFDLLCLEEAALRQAHAAHPGDDHQSFRLLDSFDLLCLEEAALGGAQMLKQVLLQKQLVWFKLV